MTKYRIELRRSPGLSEEERRRRLHLAYSYPLSLDEKTEQETQDKQQEDAQEVEEAQSDETNIER
jgi:hypothetical protein